MHFTGKPIGQQGAAEVHPLNTDRLQHIFANVGLIGLPRHGLDDSTEQTVAEVGVGVALAR